MRFSTAVMAVLACLIVFAGCSQPTPTPTSVPPPISAPTVEPTLPPTLTPPPAPTAGELAELGRPVYARSCASCHDGGFAPSTARWIQRFSTAQQMFGYARSNMPPSARGGLPVEEYLQIVAYVLVGHKVVQPDAALDISKLADIAIPK